MKKEVWSSKMGVVLAVAGSAVGLGNFLKFPGLVAMYGGAAFMIAYVLSFFLVGVPISVLEWTIGRRGGELGYHSSAGILGSLCGSKKMAYFGIVGPCMTLVVYCYYVYIESWCLGYAYHFLMGNISFNSLAESGGFFSDFVGAASDGAAVSFSPDRVFVFFLAAFVLNFYIIYRGVSGGIESFCKYAMPTLVVLGAAIVIKMMTLGCMTPDHPERSINQGLGFMWNPVKVELRENVGGEWKTLRPLVGDAEISAAKAEAAWANALSESAGGGKVREVVSISVFKQLSNPSIWIAAAGQVFFSLTVGFSAIMTYASFLKKKADVVLSSVSSCATNEFFEVCLGGMITVPAAVAFFGVAGAIGAGLSLFDLGFKVLPLVFFNMPAGGVFGFLFFFLLFVSAVTSSISMLMPNVAFIEEATGFGRRGSLPMLGIITFFVSSFVLFFSADLKAMDTMDFWIGQVTLFVFATVQTVVFSWKFGAERGRLEANEGSVLKLPKIYSFVVKYISPLILFSVFACWLARDVFGVFGSQNLSPYILDIFGEEPNRVARFSCMIIIGIYVFYALMLYSSKKYDNLKGGAK